MVVLIKNADKLAGKIICRILSLFKRKSKFDENPKNILVIQLWGIGETVLTLPALSALRQKFPNSRIHLLVTQRNKDVYYKNRNLDSLVVLDTNPFSILLFVAKNFKKFDLAIDMEEYLNISAIISFFAGNYSLGYSHGARAGLYDLTAEYNDKQHACLTYLDLTDALGASHRLAKLSSLEYSDSDKKLVNDFLEFNGLSKFVIVAPGAAESAKSRIWPLDRYSKLCDKVIGKYGLKIVFVGSKGESELVSSVISGMKNKPKAVDSCGRFTLNQLFYLIKKASVFIGNDSGPMHIAAAQGTKTLGLFGPNIPLRFGPLGKGNVGLYKGYNCPFSPCINVHKGQIPDCLYAKNSPDYQKCMKNISVDDAFAQVEKLI